MPNFERSIVLIGFMGAGKSAVGRELERLTRAKRYDTDEMIRKKFALSIAEIFAQHGEETFRETETAMLRAMPIESPIVLVTGGGIVLRPENRQLLPQLGRVVWLDAREEVLWQRVSQNQRRPLLQSENPRERFSLLRRERMPFYEQLAEKRIDTSGLEIGEIAKAILEK